MIRVFTVRVANTNPHTCCLYGVLVTPTSILPSLEPWTVLERHLTTQLLQDPPAHEMPSTHQMRDTPVLPVISQLRHLDDCHGCHGWWTLNADESQEASVKWEEKSLFGDKCVVTGARSNEWSVAYHLLSTGTFERGLQTESSFTLLSCLLFCYQL